MKFDFTPAHSFIAHLGGKMALDEVLAHPAYQAVFSHNRLLGNGLTEDDVAAAVQGEPSPYYGMKDGLKNLPLMEDLLIYIEDNQDDWLREALGALSRLFSLELLEPIVLCPIVGYDAGIGHMSHVCVNLNRPVYWQKPYELLYLLIHEACHAAYEHHHPLPNLHKPNLSSAELYKFLFQYEGYAVWAPLSLRQEKGHPGDPDDPILKDYLVLADDNELAKHVASHDLLVKQLEHMPLSEYLESDFSQRLPYRVGAALVREIAQSIGLEAVSTGATLKPGEFITRYNSLLDKYR